MPADSGGDGTTASLTPSVDVAPTTARGQHTVAGGSDSSIDGQSIQYPEGQSHGVTVYVQLNDDNALYESLTDAQRDLNNERGENGTSQNPHCLGTIEASWTDGKDELGFFSSGAKYGKKTDHGITQFYKQHLSLYEDTSEAKKANNPAKIDLRVHKRSDELVYTKDGNELTWPAGWQTGHRYEGTLLKIQASYINHPSEAIAHAFELIEASDLLSGHELRQAKDPIGETIRFRAPESHHRFHQNHKTDAVNTLLDSAKLVGSVGSGSLKGDIEKGHYQIFAFENDRIDFLGFDDTIEWEYKGETYTKTVDSHYMKVYQLSNAEHYPTSDPRAHPKIEVEARGAYPAPAWDAVKKHLDTILNAHTADLAGVPKSGLVEDMYHDGSNQEEIVTQSPADYRNILQNYYKSTGLKKDIFSLLVNNRTDSAKDILYTLIRLGRPLTYDELKEETGLTKGTIQKWVRELEDLAIVYRERDAVVVDHHTQSCMFISMTDFVREQLRDFIEKLKPAGDVKREIKRRKQERIEARESTSESTSNTEAIATDGGVNHPPENKSTETQSVDSQDTPAIADRPPD